MEKSTKIFSGNWHLLVVLIIEGASLMAVEIMGAKFLTPFFGSSLYVWTAVLVITVLGLTVGYYFGGELSTKENPEKYLLLLIGIAAILSFLMPYSSAWLTNITGNLNLKFGLIVTCLLFLLPPLVCFGMVGPLVVRLLTKKLDQLGKVAGTVYFTSTSGGIIATFLFSFYLIPDIGLHACSMYNGMALTLLTIIIFLQSKLIKPKETNVLSEESINQISDNKKHKRKKEKNKSTIEIKKSIFLFALLEGAMVMAIELLAARMLAPYYGASLYVWGTVIGITLFSLAGGYYLGGYLADKFTGENALYWVMLIAGLFTMVMHISSTNLAFAFVGINPKTAVIILSTILLFPPLLCLGTVPSLLIKLLSNNPCVSGKTTGNVYTLSSLGGILGLLVIGFFVIPEYGLTKPSIIIGLILGIVPFLKLIKQKKYHAFTFVLILVVSFSSTTSKVNSADVNIKYFSEGLLGQVLVADVNKQNNRKVNDRILFVNRMGHTYINRSDGTSKWSYINYATAIGSKLPENSNVLLLGLGGGTIANAFQIGLKFKVDAIELDARIAKIAKKYFSLNNQTKIIVDDARHYIETVEKKYDLIFFDVAKGETFPSHVLSKECFLKSLTLLKENGFMIINFNGFITGKLGRAGRSLYKTLNEMGLKVKLLPTKGTEENRNSLFIASTNEIDFNNVRFPLLQNNTPVKTDTLFIDITHFNSGDEIILTDDKPQLDHLTLEASGIWRKGYTEGYTKMFKERGVPLFN